MDSGMEVQAPTQHQTLFIMFMQYLCTILNFENLILIKLSGRIFDSRKIYFWLAKMFSEFCRTYFVVPRVTDADKKETTNKVDLWKYPMP